MSHVFIWYVQHHSPHLSPDPLKTHLIEGSKCLTDNLNKGKVSLHLKRSWATEDEETFFLSTMTDVEAAEHKFLRNCRKCFSVTSLYDHKE
jgi:hypothetical protein